MLIIFADIAQVFSDDCFELKHSWFFGDVDDNFSVTKSSKLSQPSLISRLLMQIASSPITPDMAVSSTTHSTSSTVSLSHALPASTAASTTTTAAAATTATAAATSAASSTAAVIAERAVWASPTDALCRLLIGVNVFFSPVVSKHVSTALSARPADSTISPVSNSR